MLREYSSISADWLTEACQVSTDQGPVVRMLASLLIPSFLMLASLSVGALNLSATANMNKASSSLSAASASLAPIALAPDSIPVMPKDALGCLFSKTWFSTLYQVSYASKVFRTLADRAIWERYTIRHAGETVTNYTLILHELEALVQAAGHTRTVTDANIVLQASAHFICIKSLLEARFGCCIRYPNEGLPEFCLNGESMSVLHDKHQITALPYIIDQHGHDRMWLYFLRRLVELERHDLMDQLTFSKISGFDLYTLMSVALPEPLVTIAVNSFCYNEPASGLADSLGVAGFGDQLKLFPEEQTMPLFLLQDLYRRRIQIPKCCIFIQGLDESSIRFWRYVLEQEPDDAKRLFDIVLNHGNAESRHLAWSFYGPVSGANLEGDKLDVYQAMLIYFRFSLISNDHVIENYDIMRRNLVRISYHTACALLDQKMYESLDPSKLAISSDVELSSLIDKMYRLQNDGLTPSILKCLGRIFQAPRLLKRLIQLGADSAFIELVWASIQRTPRLRMLDDYACLVPLANLKHLASEGDFTADAVKRMLGTLGEIRHPQGIVSIDRRVLYTVMFWEAPEKIIEHFLDQITGDCVMDQEVVENFLEVLKYSPEFWRKIVNRFKLMESPIWKRIKTIRPDVVMQCCL